MHQQVMDWLKLIKSTRPDIFTGNRVLECGSLDINGTPRPLFEDCEYVGIDWRDGPGVDVVCLAHEYSDCNSFDVVVSTEMLEHDPYWRDSIENMIKHLRRGGDMFLTFGGPSRVAHEIAIAPVEGYYQGVGSWEVCGRLSGLFNIVHIWDDMNDVYMWCEGKK